MKRAKVISLTCLFVLAGGARSLSLGMPPREKKEAAIVPEMIGEGVISTPDDEFGGTPAPDGKTLYFDKTVPGHYLYVLCESKLANGKWSKPEVLPFSGEWRDSDGIVPRRGNDVFCLGSSREGQRTG